MVFIFDIFIKEWSKSRGCNNTGHCEKNKFEHYFRRKLIFIFFKVLTSLASLVKCVSSKWLFTICANFPPRLIRVGTFTRYECSINKTHIYIIKGKIKLSSLLVYLEKIFDKLSDSLFNSSWGGHCVANKSHRIDSQCNCWIVWILDIETTFQFYTTNS